MKNKYMTFVALAATALATSCTSDEFAEQKQNQDGTKTVTLTASINEPTTRMGLTKRDGSTALFYWHHGDEIFVPVKSADDDTYTGALFTNTDDTGKTTAVFSGEVAKDAELGTCVLYPYNENHEYKDDMTLSYYLPAEYTYDKVEGGIFSKEEDGVTTYRSISNRMPMLGTVNSDNICFRPLSGVALIRIDKMPAAEGTLTVTANQQLCGNFTVSGLYKYQDGTTNLYETQDAVIKTPEATTTENNKVTIHFKGAEQGNTGVFYLPLAVGEYSNVKITIAYGEESQTIPYGHIGIAAYTQNVWAISLTTYEGKLRSFWESGYGDYQINGQMFVDLGLPSGLLWALVNVGADEPTDDGGYFAWGEVTAYGEAKDFGDGAAKTYYDWENYKYGTEYNLTKYNSTEKTVLEAEDDAATVNWGVSCRMPTKTDFEELKSNCTWTWTNEYTSSGSSVGGYRITSNTNSMSIFLPASGRYFSNGDRFDYGSYGYYWSSTLNSEETSCAYVLNFSSFCDLYSESRCYGFTIRPVATK